MSSTTEPSAPLPPTELGPFRVLGVLGEGGSGVVYAARWGHREVALKVLHPAFAPSGSERERFFVEARLLAETSHPGVVKVLDVGALPDGRPYLAMEKLDGETLAARLRRGPIELPAALGLFAQLADAVETLHLRGLVHRDLKPENVMLVRGGDYAVLLDFGIAKALDAPASTVTQDGGVRGTPAYMAPERFFGQPASVATDVYELGVTLYAMLVGRLPWGNSADPEARLNPARPSELGAPLPPPLEIELLRALSTRAQSRPERAAAFAHAVAEAANAAGIRPVRRTADLVATNPRRTAELSGPAPHPVATAQSAPHALHAPTPHGPARLPSQFTTAPGHFTPEAYAPTVPHVATDGAHRTGPGHITSAGSRSTPEPRRSPRRLWWTLGVSAAVVAAGVVLTIVLLDGSPQPLAAAASTPDAEAEPAVVPPATTEAEPAVAAPDPAVFDLHPAESGFVAGVNLAAVRSSALAPLLESLRQQPDFAILLALGEVCSIDPLRDVDYLSIGLRSPEHDEFDLVLAGNWDRARVERCLGGAAGLAAAGPVERMGRLTRIGEGEDAAWLAWLDERTVLFSTRSGVDEAWADARLRGADPVSSGPLGPMLAGVDRTRAVWFAGDPGDAVGERLQPKGKGKGKGKGAAGPEPTALFGSVHIGSDLAVDVSLRYRSAKEAERARAEVQKELDEVMGDPASRALIGQVEVRQADTDVRIQAALSAFITRLIATAVAEELARAGSLQ